MDHTPELKAIVGYEPKTGDLILGDVSFDPDDNEPYLGYTPDGKPVLFYEPSGEPVHGYNDDDD